MFTSKLHVLKQNTACVFTRELLCSLLHFSNEEEELPSGHFKCMEFVLLYINDSIWKGRLGIKYIFLEILR